MDAGKPDIILPVVEFAILAVLMLATPAIVALDVDVFLHGSSEVSVTELSQEALVFLSAAMFAAAAWRNPGARAWLVLVAGLFTCMFIREIDMWFDRIAHGFWVYPALLVAISAIAYAARHRASLTGAFAEYAATRSHVYIAVGLLIVVFFSRVFGSGSFWQAIMSENYLPAYKTFIQEGLELLGYVLVGFGSVRYFLLSLRAVPGGRQDNLAR